MAKNLRVQTVTIASSGTTSTSLTLEAGRIPIAIQTPSALTGTAFTFNSSSDSGANFVSVYDGSTQYSVNVGTSRHIALSRDAMDGVKVFQVVSGSTETASRTITVISGE